MKILFLALNSAWIHSNPALFYLRRIIKDLPHQSTMAELNTKMSTIESLQIILAHNPEIICLSVYIWNRVALQNLLPEIRKLLPEVRFVCGGPEVEDVNFQNLLTPADFSIIGAGEAEFYALAKANFEHGTERQDAKYMPLKDIPFLYAAEDKACLQNRLIYYESGRGCPYGCIYCLSANDKRREQRFDLSQTNEIDRLYDELRQLQELEPRTIKFVDRSFNVDKALTHAIWRYFVQNPGHSEVHFEIYPDLLSEEDFLILQEVPTNLMRFEIGIQSTNPEVMQRSGRYSDWNRSKHAIIELVKRTNITLHADLLFGLPGEDIVSIRASINDLALCFPHEIQAGMLKILPNTPMRELAISLGYKYLDNPPYQVLSSDALSFEELCELEDLSHIMALYWNKGEFQSLWHALLELYPMWDVLQNILLLHQKHAYPYHSIDQKKRFELIRELIRAFYPDQVFRAALIRDYEILASKHRVFAFEVEG